MHDHCSAETMNIEGLIEAQRTLSRLEEPIRAGGRLVCVSGILKARLAVLPDEAVGQLMFDHVWSELNLLGPESVIVEIASERLLHSSPVPVKNTKENLNR